MKPAPDDAAKMQEIREAFDLARVLVSKMLLLPVAVRKQIAADVNAGYELFKDITIER